jgi:hypothetical protein
MVMHFGYLFRCTVFCNAMTARMVGQNMDVSQEWPLRFLNYERFMGMLWACATSGNSDTLLLLGLVKTLCFSLLNTAIYLMSVFGGRKSFMNWVKSEGAPTHTADSGQWTR